MRVLLLSFVFLVLGVFETGCSAAPRGVAPPRVTIKNLVAYSTPGQQRFRVTLVIDNLNTEPLAIREIEFKLRLADEGIIDGRALTPVTIGALEQSSLTLELTSDLISSLSRLLAFVQGPENTIPYAIYGTITLDRRRLNPLRFSSQGQIPLAMSSG
jgi:LEA14-like dessication related protein